jgi:hypothetical protein
VLNPPSSLEAEYLTLIDVLQFYTLYATVIAVIVVASAGVILGWRWARLTRKAGD